MPREGGVVNENEKKLEKTEIMVETRKGRTIAFQAIILIYYIFVPILPLRLYLCV